jgi:hypothetical protein
MARERREKAATASTGKLVPETRTRKGGNVQRATKDVPVPTVIEAGKSKLSDAGAPLVIHVTDEQANRILRFTARGEH